MTENRTDDDAPDVDQMLALVSLNGLAISGIAFVLLGDYPFLPSPLPVDPWYVAYLGIALLVGPQFILQFRQIRSAQT
ncbi:hypothetical protein NDI85_19950 [Halomicroarcula sp. S1AR25-4]|uniref:hypothetical protein n=1 Tax=Haloarcula sp. S1AR25-4 TaxID=2950538 RepID=UPI0028755244|nr:hypothetical protein [Halomicroarcula sp. S1AR25-4]MDS0280062.1 hypothetical protein [Halomicroarcula sp. S1AR25-4]